MNAGIVERAPADVILGTNFLIEYDAVIDFKDRKSGSSNYRRDEPSSGLRSLLTLAITQAAELKCYSEW